MGIWDVIYSVGDRVKGITPDPSTVKRAGGAAYCYTSAAVTKIDQVVRVDGIQKLPQYWSDGETKAQITLFTTTLAKNSAKYAVYEGFKHIPGAKVATKLVTDTMHEVKGQNKKDGLKARWIGWRKTRPAQALCWQGDPRGIKIVGAYRPINNLKLLLKYLYLFDGSSSCMPD